MFAPIINNDNLLGQLSRRTLLAGAAILGTTGLAAAQSNDPIEGNKGGTILGPRNSEREGQGPDIMRPPETDKGSVKNHRFSFADAHMKMREGGWSREVTERELPIATTVAGVNMRLTQGGVRELHWHKQAEWSFMLAGKARITAVDNDGHNFIADVGPGDLWYFPSGIPHSIQGIAQEGCEFLLAFPDGGFSEDSTFAITDMFAHMPKDALAKNFGVDQKMLANIPSGEKFIFKAPLPPALEADTVGSALGKVPLDMAFRLFNQKADTFPGGTVRIADTRNFTVSTDIAAAHVEIKPGHMREVHWHPNADEWQYYVSGKARMTVFAAEGNARTFDFQAGDVGYVEKSFPHFVENIGNEPVRMLEIFNAPHFVDVSLKQWMALTPHELVQAHLNLDKQMLDSLPKDKQPLA
ncbi:MAG: cupin domain-containing protein [Pseudolabrys sp.]|nr:cupin domain-containing protein [Pseudolabrys sp.]